MEEKSEEQDYIVDDRNIYEEEVVRNFNDIANKVRFKAFGK